MEPAIIVAVVSLLSAPLAAFITWLFNRRKTSSEIYNVISESAQTSVETMQSTMNTLHAELKSTQDKVSNLVLKIKELEIQILKLKADLTESEKENIILKERIYMLTASLQSMAVERNDYI